jgi:hypothetical protein
MFYQQDQGGKQMRHQVYREGFTKLAMGGGNGELVNQPRR